MYPFFFFNDTATTEIYTLSLHDALPICLATVPRAPARYPATDRAHRAGGRSEEHTSELQSRPHLVCRLLLEKKNRLYSTISNCFQTAAKVTNVISLHLNRLKTNRISHTA